MSTIAPTLRRRFVQVGDRRVHYLRIGSGPPALLIHSSPSDAWYVVPHMRKLADRFTCFAFDSPGFGASDALPGDDLPIAALADALADNLRALELPACPVFGTHTGAVIGLSLAARHPERVTALVVDGLPLFTKAEQDDLFDDYFRPLEIDASGGHYAQTWTRFRDQYVWFPWVRKEPDRHNETDLGSPEAIDTWVRSFFCSGRTFAPAYRAACCYGDQGYADLRAVRCPVFYTAVDSDMLRPHLERLEPKLPDGQQVRRIGNDPAGKDALIAEVFDRWPALGDAPSLPAPFVDGPGIRRQFCDLSYGQVHVRHAGSLHAPPLLVLHDAPGSAAALARPGCLIGRLAEHFFVIAPDLPGSGESDPLPASDTGLRHWAAAMAEVCRQAGVGQVRVHGIGAGASVALSLAMHHRPLVAAVVVCGVALPDAAERVELRARYAPPIAIEADGSHWYRTWLMLRDQQVWFPWYDRRASRLRRQPADFGAEHLHAWTFEVLKQRAGYAALLNAVFDDDAGAALDTLTMPLAIDRDPRVPFSIYDEALVARRPDAHRLTCGDGLIAFLDHASPAMAETGS